MKTYPFVFTFCNVVRNDGFAAAVLTKGHAVMELQDAQWWMSGVQPGGIVERGIAPAEAYQRFREAFRRILDSLCAETTSCAAFEQEVRKFFADVDVAAQGRWAAARQRIRSGEKVDAPFSGLRRDETDAIPTVEVRKLDRSMPGRDDDHAVAA